MNKNRIVVYINNEAVECNDCADYCPDIVTAMALVSHVVESGLYPITIKGLTFDDYTTTHSGD